MANPFEVLRLPPDASERDIMLRVRRPYEGADSAALQQAAQEVRFSAEKRGLHELTTFHMPDYKTENAPEDLSPLGAFVSRKTLETIGAPLLDYLLDHLAEAAGSLQLPSTASRAVEYVALIDEADPWLTHDLGLLCLRHIERLWDKSLMGSEKDIKANNISGTAQLFFVCALAQADGCELAKRLSLPAEGQSEAGAAFELYVKELQASIERLFASAVNNNGQHALRILSLAWFGVQTAWRENHRTSSFAMDAENRVNAELNRNREKLLSSGIEAQGVTGNHGLSLQLMSELLLQGCQSERLIEVLLDGCNAWLNEYINANMTERIANAVKRIGRICESVLEAKTTAKLKTDARGVLTRSMYVAYDMYNKAGAAMSKGNMEEGKRLLSVSRDVAQSLPGEATITVNSDGNREDTTATMLLAEIAKVEKMVGKQNTKLSPILADYQTCRKRYDDDEYDACIAGLKAIILKLDGKRDLLQSPLGMGAGDRTGQWLLDEARDLLKHALLYGSLHKLGQLVERMKSGDRDVAQEAAKLQQWLDEAPRGASVKIGQDKTITRLEILIQVENLLDAAETKPMNEAAGAYMEALKALAHGDMRAARLRADACLALLEGLRDQAYIIVTGEKTKMHCTRSELVRHANLVLTLLTQYSSPPDRSILVRLADFTSDCLTQDAWEKKNDKALKERMRAEGGGVVKTPTPPPPPPGPRRDRSGAGRFIASLLSNAVFCALTTLLLLLFKSFIQGKQGFPLNPAMNTLLPIVFFAAIGLQGIAYLLRIGRAMKEKVSGGEALLQGFTMAIMLGIFNTVLFFCDFGVNALCGLMARHPTAYPFVVFYALGLLVSLPAIYKYARTQ